MCSSIEDGAQTTLPWDAVSLGHPQCHSYAATLLVNQHVHPLLCGSVPVEEFLQDFAGTLLDRRRGLWWLVALHLRKALMRPIWYWRGLRYLSHMIWRCRSDLIAARGKVNRLSMFVQNFMDAEHLEQERIDACSFMVMTAGGPVSMCEHNARRDEYILKPIRVTKRDGETIVFNPLDPMRTGRKRTGPKQSRPS